MKIMIQASELRIGNIVLKHLGLKDGEPNWVETSIDILGISSIVSLGENFRAIPITKDWLIRLGFKENNWNSSGIYTYYGWRDDNFDLEDLNGVINYKREVEIKYVHQLQNLYHALTGKELEVKK